MAINHTWRNWVIGTALVMIAFAYPHLIDDFLYGIPAEFGLSNQQAQVLTGLFSVLLFTLLCGAARGAGWGYVGAGFLGGFLALAVLLKHVPQMLLPEPYWSGAFSESLNWGLFLSGLALMLVSILAFRQSLDQRRE